ncbi:MAG: hypothetical protein KTU85_02900 [Acidimicrobiia bacterium]|nr:hypothetical protein [Acidimicrobiia bacterium]MCY4458696.1 hypothetical protein [Acidimicrobiaceae bacterium]
MAHLVVPDEVQVLRVSASAVAGSPRGRSGSREIAPALDSLHAGVAAIAAAERPLVVVGGGARAGIEEIVAFAEVIDAPLASTFKAKGLVSDQHRLAAGVLGRSGAPVASWFINESDLKIYLRCWQRLWLTLVRR